MNLSLDVPAFAAPETYPQFRKVVLRICEKSPIQKKRLSKELRTRDAGFFEEAELVVSRYTHFLQDQNLSIDYAVDAYLDLCADMVKCQALFQRTGRYPSCAFLEALQNVYQNDSKMTLYMTGLALSQFLWRTHYDVYSCFSNYLKLHGARFRRYLEIGPGHGLFLARALEYLPPDAEISAVDVSETSLRITQSILPYFSRPLRQVAFLREDILTSTFSNSFDFIAMGEVLEHVEQPLMLLKKLAPSLNKDGRLFVSTCVDCPAIDHIYQFRSVEDIRGMLAQGGYAIEEERVLPVEDLPMEDIARRHITINYCAVLTRS